ncbi:MAG: cytochrome c [Opitutaceae bacterium]
MISFVELPLGSAPVRIPLPSPMPLLRPFICSAAIALLASAALPAAESSARDLYKKNCVDCHGADGRSQTRLGRKSGAKNLTDSAGVGKLTDDEVFATIKAGRKNKKGEETMEAFGDRLADEQIKALVAYVRSFAK